jgi:hypothetical protein
MTMRPDLRDRGGAIDVRWILTVLVISLAALAAGAALGLWLGS